MNNRIKTTKKDQDIENRFLKAKIRDLKMRLNETERTVFLVEKDILQELFNYYREIEHVN